jgi:hypothetical protein
MVNAIRQTWTPTVNRRARAGAPAKAGRYFRIERLITIRWTSLVPS